MYPVKIYETTIPSASVRARIRIERQIVRALIDELLATGFELSVDDGGENSEWTTKRSEAIAAIMNTDEDVLHVRNGDVHGWVTLVYGNDGWDVISDYTCNLEEGGHITRTLALVQCLGDKA